MSIKITSTRQSIDAVNMIIYGDSGVGKTTLCSTAPSPIIISAEKGLLSLADFDLPAIEVQTIDELEEAYQWCLSNKKDYETICIDSITEIGEMILKTAQAKYADGRKAYGDLAIDCMDYVNKFNKIEKKHVFTIAQIDRFEDGFSGISTFKPSMPGKTLVKKLPFKYDEVLALRIGSRIVDGKQEDYRYLQTQPDVSYLAKDRSGKLNSVERPNLKIIINKIMGKSAPKKAVKSKEESENAK